MSKKTGCLLCGEEVVYQGQPTELKCESCGQVYMASEHCRSGHYICNNCHNRDAISFIPGFCRFTSLTDPVAIANALMNHPSVKMHGPEHHFLVPMALITALCNSGYKPEKKEEWLDKALKRGQMIPGGFCGMCGNCGAGVGTGIFISIITGATPTSGHSWKLANRMTSIALGVIADHGGPRCCKLDSYHAILSAAGFLEKEFSISTGIEQPVVCTFSPLNRECLKEECSFYPRDL